MTIKKRHGCVLVSSLAVLIYLNSLPGEFVFDDHEAIETNPDVRSDTPLFTLLSHDFWGYPIASNESHKSYRPLATLSFRWNRQLHGLWAPGYHVVNVLLHALVSCLYFILCERLLGKGWTSVTATILFAIHPIHTDAVSSIVGRTELLCSIFFLLSLLAYQKTSSLTQRATQARKNLKMHVWLFLTIFFSMLSLLSKEQGITVFGVCAAYEILLVMNFDLSDCLKSLIHFPSILRDPSLRVSLHRLLALLISCITLLCGRLYLNGREPPLFVESDNPASFSSHWPTRALTYMYLWGLNMWLLVFPSGLCFDWSMGSIPLVETLWDCRNVLTVATLLMLISLLLKGLSSNCGERKGRLADGSSHKKSTSMTDVNGCNNNSNSNNGNTNCTSTLNAKSDSSNTLTMHPWNLKFMNVEGKPNKMTKWRLRQGNHLVLLALALMGFPFLPASNLIFPVGFVVAERVLYIPSMGSCLLVALGMARLFTYISLGHWSALKATVKLLVGITIAIHASKTLRRNFDWWDNQLLAESAVSTNPGNAKVFATIGNVYAQQGARKCEAFYREALRLRPNYTSAWTNLGLVLLNTERPMEAERCYRRALSIQADHINANTNMGHLCRMQQRWKEAVSHYRTVLSRRPDNPTILYNLGIALVAIGGPSTVKEAELCLRHCIQLSPTHTNAILSLARLLSNTSSSGKQVRQGYSTGRRLKESISLYQVGLSGSHHRGENWMAHYELGKILLFKKGLDEAAKELSLAVQLAPKFAPAHQELGNALKLLGLKDKADQHFKLAQTLE